MRAAAEEIDALLEFDTCKVANAIEALGIRLRNEGFTHPGLHCVTGGSPAVIGYAATSKVKAGEPPMKGATWPDLGEWWDVISRTPRPRIAVIADTDRPPGQGAVLSDVHATILRRLECRALVTNGSIRNVPALDTMGFPAFASHISLSHAYVHLIAYDCPVEILGLTINPSDLLYADIHGVISIPEAHVSDIIRLAKELGRKEQTIIDLCAAPSFSVQKLRNEIRRLWSQNS